eukprot:SAG11_NODE_37219_length_258_cov_0.616352_1_plen_29_part_10
MTSLVTRFSDSMTPQSQLHPWGPEVPPQA